MSDRETDENCKREDWFEPGGISEKTPDCQRDSPYLRKMAIKKVARKERAAERRKKLKTRMRGKAQRDGRPRGTSKPRSYSLLFVDQSTPAYLTIFAEIL